MQTGSCIKGPAFAKMADARTRCSSLILLLLVLNGTEIFAKEIFDKHLGSKNSRWPVRGEASSQQTWFPVQQTGNFILEFAIDC